MGSLSISISAQHPEGVDADWSGIDDANRSPDPTGFGHRRAGRILEDTGDRPTRSADGRGTVHLNSEHVLINESAEGSDIKGMCGEVPLRIPEVCAVEPDISLVEDSVEFDPAPDAGVRGSEMKSSAVKDRTREVERSGLSGPVPGNGHVCPIGIVGIKADHAGSVAVTDRRRSPRPIEGMHEHDRIVPRLAAWVSSDQPEYRLAVPLRRVGPYDPTAVRDMVPLCIPAIPFGLVVGLAISESAMPVAAGQSLSTVVFAGAAQLTAVTLAGVASWWAVVLAVAVINARHVMYSAALAPMFANQPLWMRLFAPVVLVDQQFALMTLYRSDDPRSMRRYYLTAGVGFWGMWQLATGLGILIGPAIPAGLRLGFAPAVMFTGLVVLSIRGSAVPIAAASAAIAGSVVSAAGVGLRDRAGILVGAIVGVAVGTVVEWRGDRSEQ